MPLGGIGYCVGKQRMWNWIDSATTTMSVCEVSLSIVNELAMVPVVDTAALWSWWQMPLR